MQSKTKVRTCLWFDSEGANAAEFYVSLLPDSRIDTNFSPEADKPPFCRRAVSRRDALHLSRWRTELQTVTGSVYRVRATDQAETDRLWVALTANGGQESQCGWLVDRFGVSWQIVPDALVRMLSADDRRAANRAMEAMMSMKKIDIGKVESAFREQ